MLKKSVNFSQIGGFFSFDVIDISPIFHLYYKTLKI